MKKKQVRRAYGGVGRNTRKVRATCAAIKQVLKSLKTYKTGLFVETGLDKLLERFAVAALERGRVVLWDEE